MTNTATSLPDIGTIFLLFEGSSCDGLGSAPYKTYTLDLKEAKAFFDEGHTNPYSISYVVAVNKTEHKHIIYPQEWERYL
jgi:hypothetical protein